MKKLAGAPVASWILGAHSTPLSRPPSQVPRLRDGTLVPPLPQSAVGFPEIPGVSYTGVVSVRELYDYGSELDCGIISKLPPVPTGRAYPTLVPKVNRNGIDLAGVRLRDIAVPLGNLHWLEPDGERSEGRIFDDGLFHSVCEKQSGADGSG
jgi:hypothetical protein